MDLLRNAGAEVVGPTTTLADTIALAGSSSLACAVLDVNLGQELVFPAAQLLRQRSIGLVFQTGWAALEKLRLDWPDALVLTKPVPADLLIRTVHEACRRCGWTPS